MSARIYFLGLLLSVLAANAVGSVRDITSEDAFSGETERWVSVNGRTTRGETVWAQIHKNGISFGGFSHFVCPIDYSGSNMRGYASAKFRILVDGVQQYAGSRTADISDDHSYVWFRHDTLAQSFRFADDIRVRIYDGCGNESILLFDASGYEGSLLGSWYPYQSERKCRKAQKKLAKSRHQPGSMKHNRLKGLVDERCSDTGPNIRTE